MSRFYHSLNELRATEQTLSTVAARITAYLTNIRKNTNIPFTQDELDTLNLCLIDYGYIGGQEDLWAESINTLSEKTTLQEETTIFEKVKTTLVGTTYIERANACARIAINYTNILNVFHKIPESPEKTVIQRELIAPVQRLTRLPLIANEWDKITKENPEDYSLTLLVHTVQSIKAKFLRMALKLNDVVNPPQTNQSVMDQFIQKFLTLINFHGLSKIQDENRNNIMNSAITQSITKNSIIDTQTNEQEPKEILEATEGFYSGLNSIYTEAITSGLFCVSPNEIAEQSIASTIEQKSESEINASNAWLNTAGFFENFSDMQAQSKKHSNATSRNQDEKPIEEKIIEEEEIIYVSLLPHYRKSGNNLSKETTNNVPSQDPESNQAEITDSNTNLTDSHPNPPEDTPPELTKSKIVFHGEEESAKVKRDTPPTDLTYSISKLPLPINNPRYENNRSTNENKDVGNAEVELDTTSTGLTHPISESPLPINNSRYENNRSANENKDDSNNNEQFFNPQANEDKDLSGLAEVVSLIVQALLAALILGFLSAWIAASILSGGALPVILIAAAGIGAAVGFIGVGLYNIFNSEPITSSMLLGLGGTGIGASIGTILGTLVFPGLGSGIGAAIGAGIGLGVTAVSAVIGKMISNCLAEPTYKFVNIDDLNIPDDNVESSNNSNNNNVYTSPNRFYQPEKKSDSPLIEPINSQEKTIGFGTFMKK